MYFMALCVGNQQLEDMKVQLMDFCDEIFLLDRGRSGNLKSGYALKLKI